MKSILLIESNLNILENFTEYFELEGFRIFAAKKGSTGVDIARKHIPDLIISEIGMAGMDGYEVLRLILDSPHTSDIPFIFCTTKCEKNDKAMALQLGADDYIIKPGNMELLCSMANSWIRSGTRRDA